MTLQEIYVSPLQGNSTVASEQASVTSVPLSLVMIAAFGDQQIYLGPGFGSSNWCDRWLDCQAPEVFHSLCAWRLRGQVAEKMAWTEATSLVLEATQPQLMVHSCETGRCV